MGVASPFTIIILLLKHCTVVSPFPHLNVDGKQWHIDSSWHWEEGSGVFQHECFMTGVSFELPTFQPSSRTHYPLGYLLACITFSLLRLTLDQCGKSRGLIQSLVKC